MQAKWRAHQAYKDNVPQKRNVTEGGKVHFFAIILLSVEKYRDFGGKKTKNSPGCPWVRTAGAGGGGHLGYSGNLCSGSGANITMPISATVPIVMLPQNMFQSVWKFSGVGFTKAEAVNTTAERSATANEATWRTFITVFTFNIAVSCANGNKYRWLARISR